MTLETDVVIREISFTIFVNKQRLVTIAAMPQNLKELAFGFLYSEGLILSNNEIETFEFNFEEKYINFQLHIPQERINKFFQTGEKTSGCGSALSSALNGKSNNFPKLHFKPESILILMNEFQKKSVLFFQTGGVHSAAIVQNEKIRFFSEDIGRHNAVDKVIGMSVMNNIKLENCFLFSSGRISSEIVKKAIRTKIPLIVSQSAPTSKAIQLGWDYKIFIIGFTRTNKFNIYTGFNKL